MARLGELCESLGAEEDDWEIGSTGISFVFALRVFRFGVCEVKLILSDFLFIFFEKMCVI